MRCNPSFFNITVSGEVSGRGRTGTVRHAARASMGRSRTPLMTGAVMNGAARAAQPGPDGEPAPEGRRQEYVCGEGFGPGQYGASFAYYNPTLNNGPIAVSSAPLTVMPSPGPSRAAPVLQNALQQKQQTNGHEAVDGGTRNIQERGECAKYLAVSRAAAARTRPQYLARSASCARLLSRSARGCFCAPRDAAPRTARPRDAARCRARPRDAARGRAMPREAARGRRSLSFERRDSASKRCLTVERLRATRQVSAWIWKSCLDVSS